MKVDEDMRKDTFSRWISPTVLHKSYFFPSFVREHNFVEKTKTRNEFAFG